MTNGMKGLSLTLVFLIVAALGCGGKSSDSGRTGAPADTVMATDSSRTNLEQFTIVPAPQSLGEFERRKEIIYSWFPQYSERFDYAFKGVTQITFFDELGLGDLDFTLPRLGEGGVPVGNSVRLKLNGERTALATRFVADTLPGRRARGEGILGLVALHCTDTLLGHDIKFPFLQASTGRFDLLYKMNTLLAQLACCDLGPTIGYGHYGSYGDTLMIMYVFDQTRQNYQIMLLGPKSGRSYPGYYYNLFRTERGEFHRDQEGYPYMCRDEESNYIDLLIGYRWRGRKSVDEPMLRVRMF